MKWDSDSDAKSSENSTYLNGVMAAEVPDNLQVHTIGCTYLVGNLVGCT